MKAIARGRSSRKGGLLTKLLLVLGLLFAVGAILWIVLLPRLLVATVRSRTGFTVKVDTLSVNPFTANVTIKGLVLKNPAGWPVEDFVELREFHAETSLLSLFGNRFVADEVVVDVAQVTLVTNQQGRMNATAFKEGLAGKEAASSGTNKSGGKQEFLIKHLVLKFDKLVYADHSGGRPVVKEYRLNLNRDMRDVDSAAKIINSFTGSALGLVSGAFGGLPQRGNDPLKDLTGALQDAGRKTGEKLKGLLDSLDKKKP
jgi:uncharacterized protein involved in outer membrane biogenesis